MSDENVPKLRLKPKLGAEPAVAPQGVSAPAEPVPAAAAEAPKLVRLKPKLATAPAQETAPAPAEPAPAPVAEVALPAPAAPAAEAVRLKPRLTTTPAKEATSPPMPMAAPAPAPMPAAAPVPEAAPAAEPAKPAFKLGLKPKAATTAQPAAPAAAEPAGPMPPPLAAEGQIPVLDAPPPVPRAVETDTGENGEPAEITIMRKASSAPFTPPSKFPPPPGLKKAMQEAGAQVGKGAPGKGKGSRKKLILMAGGGIAALAVLVGGFMIYQMLTAPPPPPPPKPKVAKPVPKPMPAVVEQAKEQAEAPVNEVMGTDAAAKPTEAKPADAKPTDAKPADPKPAEPAATVATTPEPKPAEEVKPVAPPKPPPAPPPSVAFRGWVENLKISGVRGGANPRVFVGKSSYQKGDLVNPQMGIVFEEYNDQTRMIVFRDKSGAKVERRN